MKFWNWGLIIIWLKLLSVCFFSEKSLHPTVHSTFSSAVQSSPLVPVLYPILGPLAQQNLQGDTGADGQSQSHLNN